jgi:hypothetical protein
MVEQTRVARDLAHGSQNLPRQRQGLDRVDGCRDSLPVLDIAGGSSRIFAASMLAKAGSSS